MSTPFTGTLKLAMDIVTPSGDVPAHLLPDHKGQPHPTCTSVYLTNCTGDLPLPGALAAGTELFGIRRITEPVDARDRPDHATLAATGNLGLWLDYGSGAKLKPYIDQPLTILPATPETAPDRSPQTPTAWGTLGDVFNIKGRGTVAMIRDWEGEIAPGDTLTIGFLTSTITGCDQPRGADDDLALTLAEDRRTELTPLTGHPVQIYAKGG